MLDKKQRKELRQQFHEIKTYMGIVQITNKVNGKIFITSCPNLKNKWFTLKEQLNMGRHANSLLQKDWNELGPDAFAYEVLEEKVGDDVGDKRWALKEMEALWLERLTPYGEKGYNKPVQKTTSGEKNN